MSEIIRFERLTLAYGGRPAVEGLEGAVEAGALLAIAGPNGAGKSTLLKGIAGLIKPLAGSISMAAEARAAMAFLPQAAEFDRAFPLNVFDLAAAGAWRETGAFGGLSGGAAARVHAALEAAGLNGFARRLAGALSGGEFRRALFARLIVQDAKLILLDEPFAGIDEAAARDLMALIRLWHAEGRTIIAVMHDLELIRAEFPECLLLSRRCVARGAPRHALSDANLAAARRLTGAPAAFECRPERAA